MELKIEKILKDADIISICNDLAECYRIELKNSGHIATGELYNFTWELKINNYFFSVNFNLPEYWYYVENGRGPGKMPPVANIEKWLHIRNIIPRVRSGRVPTVHQLAYMISRKIGKIGMKGTKDLKNAEDRMNLLFLELQEKVNEKIAELLYSEYDKKINEIFK